MRDEAKDETGDRGGSVELDMEQNMGYEMHDAGRWMWDLVPRGMGGATAVDQHTIMCLVGVISLNGLSEPLFHTASPIPPSG